MSNDSFRSPPSADPHSGVSPRSVAHGATMYGPALFGTMRVDDPRALAELRAARAPEVPRPPPRPVQPTLSVLPMPPLVIAGAWLAVFAPPVGCVVSAIALGHILRARPRPPGETLAALALAASVVMMAAVLAIVLA